MSLYTFIARIMFPPEKEHTLIGMEERLTPGDRKISLPPRSNFPWKHSVLSGTRSDSLLMEGAAAFTDPLDPEPFREIHGTNRSIRFDVGLVFAPRGGFDQNREHYVWKEPYK